LQRIRSEKAAAGLELAEADLIPLLLSIRIVAVDTTLPEDASRYVLHPNALVLRKLWDPLVRFISVCFFLEVPFGIAFHVDHTVGASWASSCTSWHAH
jgi:hypothetical protein